MSSSDKSARSEDRRRRIVAAAARVFCQYGYRKSSVDTVAAAAQVAKPTLYAYFADKEALFAAVVAHVADEALEKVHAAAARSEAGSFAERLEALLGAKLEYFFELLHTSPHAQELLEAGRALPEDPIAALDESFLKLLTRLLEEKKEGLSRAGLPARTLAALLLDASHGLSAKASDLHALQQGVRSLAKLVDAAAH